MKKIFLALCIFISLVGYAQPTTVTPYTTINNQYNWRGAIFRAMNVPIMGTPALASFQPGIAGAVIIDTTGGNKGVHGYWDGVWHRLVDTSMAGFGANVNIGSGYRVAVANTHDYKTLFGSSNMVSIDSSSNTNALTFKIDTSSTGMATQSDISIKITDPTTTLGDIIYRNSTVPTRLAGNTSTVKKGLTQTGTGSGSAAPQWDTVATISTSGGTVGQAVIWNGGQSFILGNTRVDSTGILQFKVGESSDAPAAGDSDFTVSSFQGKYLEVYRYGELQSTNTDYGIEQDSSTGSWTVHPPYEANEKIIVKAYNYRSIYSVTLPAMWAFLNFSTLSAGITESPSDVYSEAGGFGWARSGLADVHLASGTDGGIMFKYEASDGDECIMGFNATNSNQNYTNMEAGVYLTNGGALSKVDSGTPSSIGASLSVGEYVGVFRSGSTFTIKKSSDGVTFGTTLATLTYSSSATMYVNININNGKMYYPKGLSLVP